MATVGVLAKGGAGRYTPGFQIAKAIRDALDPVRAPGKVKTLADMSEEEKRELEKLYGVPVKRNVNIASWISPLIGALLVKYWS